MFGHAFKKQQSSQKLLQRFKAGGGTLLDLEYLLRSTGERICAFGYWAGFCGAAVSLRAWCAQQNSRICEAVSIFPSKEALLSSVSDELDKTRQLPPCAIVIGALGNAGRGASDLCTSLNIPLTQWHRTETTHGGPYPEILQHELMLNCINANENTPRLISPSVLGTALQLSVIGDISCDPGTRYNPIPLYDEATTWDSPAIRVSNSPILDIVAINNLPALLPSESSNDFAHQLLPYLLKLGEPQTPAWLRAEQIFREHTAEM